MARYPSAAWHPSPNHGGPLTRSLGLILHVEQGSEPGTVAWFCNPKSQASAHFGVGKDGHVDEFLDTDLRSWAQAQGNADYWSVETEGFATEPLTDSQIQSIAALYRWLQQQPTAQFGFTLAEVPGQPGFGWHGMGGAAWGGHENCPGPLRRDQRAGILTLAHPSAGPVAPPQPAPPPVVAPVHDFEEAAMKSTLLRIGPLDGQGNGWGDWDPGLGRDPNIVGAVLLGPSPPDDGGYGMGQAHVTVAAQPRGGKARVVIRNGTPSDTVGVWLTVS